MFYLPANSQNASGEKNGRRQQQMPGGPRQAEKRRGPENVQRQMVAERA
jgi:hypothetical protein